MINLKPVREIRAGLLCFWAANYARGYSAVDLHHVRTCACHEIRPFLHDDPPALEEVGSGIATLDLVADRMGKHGL